MTIIDLTAQQLRRAAAIKEQIDRLNRELRNCSRIYEWMELLREKAHDERDGEKKNCCCAKDEMGEA